LVVQGFDKPFSVLGASFIEYIFYKLGQRILGDENACDIKNGIVVIIGGKIFINLANAFTKASKETLGKNFKNMNADVGEIILNMFEAEKKYFFRENFPNDETEEEKNMRLSFHRYTSDKMPKCLNYSKLGMLWRIPVAKFIFPNFFQNIIKSQILSGTAEYEKELIKYEKVWEDKSRSLGSICESLIWELTYLISQRLMPGVANGLLNGINKLKALFENENIIYHNYEKDSNNNNKNEKKYSTFKVEDLLKKHDKFTKAEVKFLIENLIKSLPNNITTKMALDLFELADILFENNEKIDGKFSEIEFDKFLFCFVNENNRYIKSHKKAHFFARINYSIKDSCEEIKNKISFEDEEIKFLFNEKFLDAYNRFIEIYGVRGEMELDLVNLRYRENPKFLLSQIFNFYESLVKKESLKKIETDINKEVNSAALNPKEVFIEAEKNRPKIFRKLYSIAEKYKFATDFRRAYELAINLAGFRETPKYFVIKTLTFFREVLLEISDIFLKLNLIDDKSEIFHIKIYDIIQIYDNKLLNKFITFKSKNMFIKRINENDSIYLACLKQQIKDLSHEHNIDRETFVKWHTCPSLIDSRGRILKNETKKIKEEEIAGESVSFGTVKGKVKVMKTADEKKFRNGDILVTKATDPGWTPLIINCGGLVIEIGGMLQHGALVAREFNKPCIVGVENAMKLFEDDEIIEVDADRGVVKKIKN